MDIAGCIKNVSILDNMVTEKIKLNIFDAEGYIFLLESEVIAIEKFQKSF